MKVQKVCLLIKNMYIYSAIHPTTKVGGFLANLIRKKLAKEYETLQNKGKQSHKP